MTQVLLILFMCFFLTSCKKPTSTASNTRKGDQKIEINEQKLSSLGFTPPPQSAQVLVWKLTHKVSLSGFARQIGVDVKEFTSARSLPPDEDTRFAVIAGWLIEGRAPRESASGDPAPLGAQIWEITASPYSRRD